MDSDRPTGDRVNICLFGGLSVTSGEHLLIDEAWPRAKARALLKLLALRQGEALHREQIFEALWPRLDAAAADNNLRKNLHYLRGPFESAGLALPVAAADATLRLDASAAAVDLHEFHARAGAALDRRIDSAAFESALAMSAAELLPEDLYEPWTESPRDAARATRQRLLLALGRLYLSQGRQDDTARCLEQLLAADPAHEDAHYLLMSMHAASGDRARALAQYERCRIAVREAAGAEPGPAVAALRDDLLHGRARRGLSAQPLGAGPLVGRSVEFETLRRTLEGAAAGSGAVCIVDGEPGIGKSRLLMEFGRYAALGGARVLRGRCSEDVGAPAYWPWRQALRDLLLERDAAESASLIRGLEADLAQLLPELGASGPDDASARDAEQARFRLFDAVSRLLRRASEQEPVLAHIDDLHTADQASLLLFEALAGELRDARVMLLAAYRDTEVGPDHPLAASIAKVAREQVNHRLHLRRLSDADAMTYIGAVATRALSDANVARICEASEGNPFYLSELVQFVESPAAAGFTAGGGTMPIPPNVLDVIRHRAGRLPAGSRDALTLAAVCGRNFDAKVIATMSGVTTPDALRALDPAVRARLIAPQPEDPASFRFSHALVVEALYADMPAAACIDAHRRAGEAIELHSTGQPEEVSALAHHWYRASLGGEHADRAVLYLREASKQATESYAWEEAVRLSELALEVLERTGCSDPLAMCRALYALGLAQTRSGLAHVDADAQVTITLQREPAPGELVLLRAAGYAKAARARDELSQIALALGPRTPWDSVRNWDPTIVACIDDAIASWQREDHDLHAQLLAKRAIAYHMAVEIDLSAQFAQRAVEMARRVNSPSFARILSAAHTGYWTADHLAVRTSIAREMIDVAVSGHDRENEAQGHVWLVTDLLESGDTPAAERALRRLGELGRELRQPLFEWYHSAQSATMAMVRGDLATAEQHALTALQLGRSAITPAGADYIFMALQLFEIRALQGRLEGFDTAMRAGVERYPGHDAPRAWLLLACVELGLLEEAREHLDTLVSRRYHETPTDNAWLLGMFGMATAACALNDAKVAETAYETLRPYKGSCAMVGEAGSWWGCVDHHLGTLATSLGRWDIAGGHFEDALCLYQRATSPPFLAMTQYELARMLSLSAPNTNRARELLKAASAAASKLGLGSLRRKTEALSEIVTVPAAS